MSDPCPRCQSQIEYYRNDVCPKCNFHIHDFLNFLSTVNIRVISLDRLIGNGFLSGQIELYSDYNRPIERALKKCVRDYVDGNKVRANFELARIDNFIKDLEIISKKDNEMKNDIVDELKKSVNDISDFYGARFEANVCASLIRKGANLEKRERPDISVKTEEGAKIYIECTTRRTPKKTEEVYEKIVYKATKGKSKKDYSGMYTALFIDATNVTYRYSDTEEAKRKYSDENHITHKNELKSKFTEEEDDLKFGSVLTFTSIYDMEENKIRRLYTRYDHTRAQEQLCSAMDAWYPMSSEPVHVARGAIPVEG